MRNRHFLLFRTDCGYKKAKHKIWLFKNVTKVLILEAVKNVIVETEVIILENGSEKKKYNRKRVNRIKRVLLFFLVILFLFPTVLSVYLMGRIYVIEQKLDAIAGSVQQGTTEESALSLTEDLAKLDEEAILNLEKDTVQSVNLLAKSEEKIEKQTEHNTEISVIAADDAEEAAKKDSVLEKDGASESAAASEDTAEASTESMLNGKTIYLTFDDGPSKNTEQILEILEEKDVKATFFVVVNEESEEVKNDLNMIKEAGHTLAIHSASHKYHEIYSSLEAFQNDVKTAHDLILSMTGVDTKFYRFPGGSSNVVSTVDINECIDYLDKAGYTYFDWNALNEDAEASYTSPEKLNENVIKYVHANTGDSMVLLHDLGRHSETVEALPELIDALREEGYRFAAIDEKTKPVQHETVEGARKALKEKQEKEKLKQEEEKNTEKESKKEER